MGPVQSINNGLTFPQCQIHRQPPIHRRLPSLGKHPLQQFHLLTPQRLLEPRAFIGQLQQTLTLVRLGRNALDQMHLQQLAQRHVQRLFAHPEQRQQLLDAQVRITGDEKYDALMHSAQASTLEHFIGLGGESLVAKEKRFHGLLLGKRVFKVKHIDVSVRASVISVNKFDSFSSCLATGDPMAFSERVSRLKSSLIREILAAAQRPQVMSFAGGLPAEAMLPKVDWADMPVSIGQYGMSEGEPALREALAAEARALGVPCEASQVLVVSGSQQTLDLAAKLYIDKGTEILLEAPTYLAALQIFQLFGADCLTVPLEADGPDLTELRARLEKHRPAFIYLIPTFQNPSAVRYSEAKRDAVAALLDEFGVTLIEDEPYRELTFDGGSATPIVSRLKKASWIYTGTVSKTLLPGLRVGYLIASPDLFPHLLKLKQSADLHTNRVGQWQALQWIGSEKYQQHRSELRDFYRGRRDAFQAALETHFSDLADWNVPQGGLFFWLKLKQPLDTRTLLNAALANDVAFMPGEPFFPEPDKHHGYLRLNFSHIDPLRLDEGLKRLAAVVRQAQAAQAA
jgi:2-aminoadipate transaminase